MEAALGLLEGPLGQQQQQLDQLLAPGAGLPEHLQGLIEGAPLAARALGPAPKSGSNPAVVDPLLDPRTLLLPTNLTPVISLCLGTASFTPVAGLIQLACCSVLNRASGRARSESSGLRSRIEQQEAGLRMA